jgi:hypothetical protein
MLENTTQNTVTDRVLRHLQRLDSSVAGLARPIGVALADEGDQAHTRQRSRGAA